MLAHFDTFNSLFTAMPNTNLSKVKIKIEDSNPNVSPKTLSPAYAANTVIKTENICS